MPQLTSAPTAPSYTVSATTSDLTEGDRYTDHLNQTHTVTSVDDTAGGTGAGYYIHVEGQAYPEFYLADQEITLHVPETVDTEAFEADDSTARFDEGDTVTITTNHDLISSEATPEGELAEEVAGETNPGDKLTVISIDHERDGFTYNLMDDEGLRAWNVEESDLETPATANEEPAFRTLTRRYLSNGNCIKASATFHTREAQSRYAAALPAHTAITSEN